jgi:hypothetical protein
MEALHDLKLLYDDRTEGLMATATALGEAGVNIEGGGMFAVGRGGRAHFLVADGERATAALRSAGLKVMGYRPMLAVRLDQTRPGQLGRLCGQLLGAGVDVEVLYSDHDGRLMLRVDDHAAASTALAQRSP